jgi:hypothetical protein
MKLRHSAVSPADPAVGGWLRLTMVIAAVLGGAIAVHGGGPEYVAGSSYFNPSVMGQPLTWAGGQISYYTDQGDLSPILPNAAANALVANSFLQWTAVATANVTANAAGQLAEDVNGGNLEVNSEGMVTAPADITPSATQDPVAIVYDYDGSVTDALLGNGAGDASQCFWNAVYGGDDNFSTGANFLHALVVINGQCALQSSQLTDVEYRLVRVLGAVLGLGWSQLNLNVITGDPPPTAADFAGFPVMHASDPVTCVPITICYANPYQLAADDTAALSSLYPRKQASGSARIYGSVYFSNHTGGPGQAMQGVNVVARWIDPGTQLPSEQYSVSAVSGVLFTGNAGNPITGFADALGNAYSEFGSTNQAMEGFFDLSGLPLPNGASTAQYQLSVEGLNEAWSAGVCPYAGAQVAPSGAFAPVTVTVDAGGEFQQDIQMTGSGQAEPAWSASETWSAPAPVLPAGDWIGSLSGYGDVAYFLINAQANRTLSVAVTALDEASAASESKAEPVVGIWTLGDPQGTVSPAFTASPFNSEAFATSRLDAQVLSSNSFIFGIADLRGDGRQDYEYHAHVLYGDSVVPARIPVSGGGVVLQGVGFTPLLQVSVGSAGVPLIATDAGQMLVTAAAQADGVQDITITDPVSGAFSTMTGVLTFGAAASDEIQLLQGSNPPTPVATQATNPMRVRVVAADGVTPVWGATIGWSASNNVALSACSGASSCSVTSDQSGNAATFLTPNSAGVATITATVAPGIYNPAQATSGTLFAISSVSSIAVTTPYLWIAQGATVSVPITARVVSSGVAQSGATVNFNVVQGSGSLSAGSAVTSSTGYATVTLTLTNFMANVQLTACVAPGNVPCATVYGNAVAAPLLNLQAVAGGAQVVTGSAFQPLTVRVTDSSSPPNAVLGASVLFETTVMRPTGSSLTGVGGDAPSMPTQVPSILSASQVTVQSDANGLASMVPATGGFSGPLQVQVQIYTGSAAFMQDELGSFPSLNAKFQPASPRPGDLVLASALKNDLPQRKNEPKRWVSRRGADP